MHHPPGFLDTILPDPGANRVGGPQSRGVGARLLPPPDRCQAWVDFDGTITAVDVLDELIRRHAVDDSWRAVEADWQAGRIGSRQCLSRQLAAVRAIDADLARLVADVPLDPGVGRLFATLAAAAVPATIVSDGLAPFITALMARAGLSAVPVRSNDVVRRGTAIDLVCPHASAACRSAAAHCKCGSIVELTAVGRDRQIYVGDGRSDLCPARTTDVVFAKGTLAASLAAEGVAFLPFRTLDDVADALAAAWASPAVVPRASHGGQAP